MPAPIGEGVLRSERLQARPVEGEREFPVAYLRGGVGVVQAHIVSGVFNGVAPYGGFPVDFLAGQRGGTGEGRDNRKADGGESNANFHFFVSTPVSRFLQALSIFWQAGFQLAAAPPPPAAQFLFGKYRAFPAHAGAGGVMARPNICTPVVRRRFRGRRIPVSGNRWTPSGSCNLLPDILRF